MSKIALVSSASGTGTLSISAPNTNSDRAIALPDAAGTLALTSDVPAAYTNSDVLSLFNASGSAPVYACRAWVNFNGTGTVAIRASGNVSSITDNGTGNYTVNFTTAMPDVNYVVSGAAGALGNTNAGDSSTFSLSGNVSLTTSGCKVICVVPGVNVYDAHYMTVAIFR
jgi:uncharacterized protein (AIM24 family)